MQAAISSKVLGFNQLSVQLNRSLRHVPRENREHCSHIVVVSKLHVGERHGSVRAYRRTKILDFGHPSLIPEVETAVDLG
ncbi:hypothetical protein A2U01_0043298, partial [Trifolium medium]|nr:hypothetical protein [Trifolium medium]